jgi:hypothetical protein
VLLVDDREDLLLFRLLSSQAIHVERTRLEFGDISHEGCGPRGPVMVGYERKHLSDVVNSLLNRRLSGHQLRGMYDHYSYVYLIIEDVWRPDDIGGIEILRGRTFIPFTSFGAGITYRQFDSFLSSLEVRGNVVVCRTANTKETAHLLMSRYCWWSKPWLSHHSHDEIYSPGPEVAPVRGKARFYSKAPGIVELMAAQLPGIDRKAWDVGIKFKTPEAMLLASISDWQSIPGVGIGIATKVMEALHGKYGI